MREPDNLYFKNVEGGILCCKKESLDGLLNCHVIEN